MENLALQTLNQQKVEALVADGTLPPYDYTTDLLNDIVFYWELPHKHLYCLNLSVTGKAYITYTKTDYASDFMNFSKAVEHAEKTLLNKK